MFLRNLHTVLSIVAVPIYIPTDSVGGYAPQYSLQHYLQ